MKQMHALWKAGALVMSTALLAACGSAVDGGSKGHVYFLNNKQEVIDQWNELAEMFTDETGIAVDIVTMTSGSGNQTLKSELAKSNPPTLLSMSGYGDSAVYHDYLLPLQDTDVYGLLTDEGKANTYTLNGDSYTLPYAVEYFGIIYNKKILDDYVGKPYAVISDVDDITGYDVLSKVAQSMQQHKDDLGIDGAFATPSLESTAAWRFGNHMTRIPVFYEYRDNNVTFMPTIAGTYLQQYKNLFDLELNNNPTEPSMVSTKTYDDENAEFAQSRVAFYPNGDWVYPSIKDTDVDDNDMGMLPYWMGIPGEEKYGTAAAYDAGWAINKNASDADIKASLEFVKWLVTDKDAMTLLAKDMGLSVPFTTFDDAAYRSDNPLTIAAREYEDKGLTTVHSFPAPTDSAWTEDIQGALLEYAQGTGKWDAVRTAFVDGWATAWKNSEQAVGTLPETSSFESLMQGKSDE